MLAGLYARSQLWMRSAHAVRQLHDDRRLTFMRLPFVVKNDAPFVDVPRGGKAASQEVPIAPILLRKSVEELSVQ